MRSGQTQSREKYAPPCARTTVGNDMGPSSKWLSWDKGRLLKRGTLPQSSNEVPVDCFLAHHVKEHADINHKKKQGPEEESWESRPRLEEKELNSKSKRCSYDP